MECNVKNKQKYQNNLRDAINEEVEFDGYEEGRSDWTNWIEETFYDAEQIIKAIDDNGGSLPLSFTLNENTANVETTNIKVVQNSNIDAEKEYLKRSSFGAYRLLQKKFQKAIVSNVIFRITRDSKTGKWETETIKRNAPSLKYPGVDTLNANIYDYKLSLIQAISNYTGTQFNTTYLSPEQFTRTILEALADFESHDDLKNIRNPKYKEALDAFVILKTFDTLLENEIDFLKSNTPVGIHSINQYEYVPPRTAQLNNYSDETADIQKTTSKLQKIILSYLPIVTIDRNTKLPKVDWNFSVEGDGGGYDIVIKAFKDYIYKLPWNNKYKSKLLSKDINIAELAQAFDKFIEDQGTLNTDGASKYILDRARSIKKFILNQNSNLPLEIKDIFYNQLMKTIGPSYVSYHIKNGRIESFKLNEQFINKQSLSLQQSVTAMQAVYRKDPERWKKLKNKWGITAEIDGTFTIGKGGKGNFAAPIVVTLSTDKNSEFKRLGITTSREGILLSDFTDAQIDADNKAAAAFITDILQTTIPENYQDVLNMLTTNNDKKTLFENFAKPVCLLIAAVDEMSGISDRSFRDEDKLEFKIGAYIDNFTDAATLLSIAYGTDVRSVLKNQEDNNLPASSLTTMGYQTPELVKRLDDSSSTVNSTNPIVVHMKSHSGKNIGIKPIVIRTDSANNDDIKASKKLNASELGFIEIFTDFLCNLWKDPRTKNVVEKRESDGNVNAGDIYIQYTTTSDKTTHPLLPINLQNIFFGKESGLTLFRNLCKFDSKEKESKKNALNAETTIQNAIINYRRNRINTQVQTLINQFDTVYPDLGLNAVNINNQPILTTLQKLQKINEKINSWSDKDLDKAQQLFNGHGFDFIFEIHYSEISDRSDFALKAKYGLNETMLHYYETYNNQEASISRFARNMMTTVLELEKNDIQLNAGLNNYAVRQLGAGTINKWLSARTGNLKPYILKDSEGNQKSLSELHLTQNEAYTIKNGIIEITDLNGNEYSLEINPVIKSCFYANSLYGNAYKDLTLGDCFNHATKYTATNDDYNADGTKKESYYVHNEASREGNGFKRAVIVGATHHPFNFATKYGTSKNISVAVMKDLNGIVWNLIGLEYKKLKAMDGSGFSSPYQAIMENWSLGDAHVGLDKKTIFGDIDPIFGGQRLLKWAVYAITNNRRRLSWGSEVRLQDVFERMHNKSITLQDDILSKYYNPNGAITADAYKQITRTKDLYFQDIDGDIFRPGQANAAPGKYYKIVSITNQGANCTRILQEVTKEGKEIGQPFSDETKILTLSNLDKVFGGAWAMELDSNNGLEFTESNNEIVANFICNNNYKNNFISYLVNESAIKVGAANINPQEKWYQGALSTFNMSLEFGGVQMDPDHELDLAQVTEMSQMISALIQNGYTTDLVNQIYGDIGKVAFEGIKDLKNNLMSGDKEKVYRIIGRALMESLRSENSTSMGLARSFVTKASEYFNKENIEYTIPFSSSNINSKFIATVISMINKSGIRRKYAGIAAVLVPSYNTIQYYRLGNQTYTYPELAELVSNLKDSYGNPLTWTDKNGRARVWTVKDVLTEIAEDENGNPRNPFIKPILPETVDIEDTIIYKDPVKNEWVPVKIDSYEKYDQFRNLWDSDIQLYNWTIKPKNLRQANAIITAFDDYGEDYTFSMYDLDSVRTDHYLNNLTHSIEIIDIDPKTQKPIHTGNFINGFNLSEVPSNKLQAVTNALNHLVNIDSTFEYDSVHPINTDEIRPLLAKLIQSELKKIEKRESLSWQSCLDKRSYNPGSNLTIESYEFRPAEMILGRLHAKELGLSKNDTIANIQKNGVGFFRNKLNKFYAFPDQNFVDRSLYDVMLLGEDGKKTLVVLGNQDTVVKKFSNKVTLTANNDYYQIGDTILYGNQEFCKAGGIDFNKCIAADGSTYDVIAINNIDKLKELEKNGFFIDTEYNYKISNWKELFRSEFSEQVDNNYEIKDTINLPILSNTSGKKIILDITKNLDSFLTSEEWSIYDRDKKETKKVLTEQGLTPEEIQQELNAFKERYLAQKALSKLLIYHDLQQNDKLNNMANLKFQAFEKQLHYIGARIPTQSMQSFMAMDLVAFSDSDTNEVYVPNSQTWLQGSDYDIDKLYILGYSLGLNGVCNTLSNLQGLKSTDFVLKLPLPDGKKRYNSRPINKVVTRLFNISEVNDNIAKSYSQAWAIDLNDRVDIKSFKDNGKPAVAFELKSKPGVYVELIKGDIDNNKVTYKVVFSSNDITTNTELIDYVIGAINVGDTVVFDNAQQGFDNCRAIDDEYKVFTRTSDNDSFSINDLEDEDYNIVKILNNNVGQVYFASDRAWTNREKFILAIETILNTSNDKVRKLSWEAFKAVQENPDTKTPNKDRTGIDLNKIEELVNISDEEIRLKNWKELDISTNTSWDAKTDKEKDIARSKSKLLNLVNTHALTKNIKGNARENGLRNQVVDKIWQVTTKIVNQNNSMNPINMDQQKAAAEKSSLGNDEKHLVLDNIMTKVIMQYQNMVGKDVIGISAVMLKNFFAASTHVNLQLEEATKALLQGRYDDVNKALQLIVFNRVFNSEEFSYSNQLATLANVNFDEILDVIDKYEINSIPLTDTTVDKNISAYEHYIDGNSLKLKELIYDLKEASERIDASDSISGLLSAATDNAKELILSKINATSTFADIYGHLLMSGVGFDAIANFMMSPILNVVSRFAKQNMFDPIISSVNLKSAIQFVLGDGQLGSINDIEVNNILFAWWKDNDGKILDTSFLPKLVYQTNDKGELLRDSEKKPIVREKLFTNNGVYITPDYIEGMFVTEPVGDGSRYKLTDDAKLKRTEILSLFRNNDVIELVIKHIEYLKSLIPSETIRRTDDEDEGFDYDDDYYDKDYDDGYIDDYGDTDDTDEEFAARFEDDDDYYGYTSSGESNEKDPKTIMGNNFSAKDYDMFIRYYEYYVKLRNQLLNETDDFGQPIITQQQILDLNTLLTSIMPATEEQSILGAMLGANQGLKTNDYDLYSFESRVSTFINKRYDEFNQEVVDDSEKLDPFNLMDFINNPNERNKQIQQYQKVMSKFNILSVISNVPHFKQMFDMTAIGETLIGFAARNRFERKLADIVLRNHNLKLSKPEFKVVQDYVTQVLTLNWIKNAGVTLNLHAGQQYYDSENYTELKTVAKNSTKTITLDTGEGIATFKHWVERDVIPTLRANNKLASNAFMKSLSYQSVKNRLGKNMFVYRFPFNPMLVQDNPTLESQWNAIVNSFNDIAQNKLSDYNIDSDLNIMDTLYLYNLITFGDKFSQSSLTKLFEDVNIKYDSSFVNSFNEWLSKLDNLTISLDDLDYESVDLLYLLSTLKSAQSKFNVSLETNSGEGATLKIKGVDENGQTRFTEIPVYTEFASDFTFNLPVQLGFNMNDVNEELQEYREKQNKNISRYELNNREVIKTVVESLQEKFKSAGIKLHIVDNAQLDQIYAAQNGSITIEDETSLQRMKEAKAFISDGEIYVNLDNASIGSAFHEYMHIVAAGLKFNTDSNIRDLYYDLLDKVQPLYKKMFPVEYKRIVEKYQDVNGSDFNEELLVRLLEATFTKKLSEQWGVSKELRLDELSGAIGNLIDNVLELNQDGGTINISRLSISSLDNILKYFNSSLFTFDRNNIGVDKVRESEKLMTLKRKLIESGELTYEQCK